MLLLSVDIHATDHQKEDPHNHLELGSVGSFIQTQLRLLLIFKINVMEIIWEEEILRS